MIVPGAVGPGQRREPRRVALQDATQPVGGQKAPRAGGQSADVGPVVNGKELALCVKDMQSAAARRGYAHLRALGDPDELAEERRLAYVGITRARQRLFLSHAWSRMLHGQTQYNPPSRFLDEIPADLMVEAEGMA